MVSASWQVPPSTAMAGPEWVVFVCPCANCRNDRPRSHYAAYGSHSWRVASDDPALVSPCAASHSNSTDDLGLFESLTTVHALDHLPQRSFYEPVAFSILPVHRLDAPSSMLFPSQDVRDSIGHDRPEPLPGWHYATLFYSPDALPGSVFHNPDCLHASSADKPGVSRDFLDIADDWLDGSSLGLLMAWYPLTEACEKDARPSKWLASKALSSGDQPLPGTMPEYNRSLSYLH